MCVSKCVTESEKITHDALVISPCLQKSNFNRLSLSFVT